MATPIPASSSLSDDEPYQVTMGSAERDAYPIFWVRCDTEYDRTPQTPTAARSSPTSPIVPKIQP